MASKFNDLEMLLNWNVPRAHLIETRVTCGPTKRQKEIMANFGIIYNYRPFTRKEDESIKANWNKLCKKTGLSDPKPFLSIRSDTSPIPKKDHRLNFARYIGKGLNDRMLCSIYRRFQVLYRDLKKGRFTKEEDTAIVEYITKYGRDQRRFKILGDMLGRHREAVHRRYKTLTTETQALSSRRHIPMFLDALKSVLGISDVSLLKNQRIKRRVWCQVSERTGFTPLQLRKLWTIFVFPRLSGVDVNLFNRVLRKVVKMFYKANIDDRKLVDWNSVASRFEGFTGPSLYYHFQLLVYKFVPELLQKDFRKVVEILWGAYRENRNLIVNISQSLE